MAQPIRITTPEILLESPTPEATEVLLYCVAECWRNFENGDPESQTAADIAADIVRYLSHVYLGSEDL